METARDRSPLWIAAAAATVTAARAWIASPKMLFFSFQVRDLERAAEVAKGRLLLWGPDLTGGGQLPGGLYYWLMSVPLRLGLGWHGCWLLLCAFWVATSGLSAYVLARRYGALSAALAALYFFLPLTLLLNFLNVSATPLFVAAGLAGVCAAFTAGNPKARARGWAAAGLAAGFGIQLHYTAGLPFAAGLMLQSFAPVLRLTRLPASAFLAGLACTGAPLLPYLAFLLFGLGTPPPAGSGSTAEALPSLYYLAREFWRPELPLEIAQKLLIMIPLPLVAALFVERGRRDEDGGLRRVLLVCALVCAIPASYYLVRPNGLRYLIPLETCLFALFAGAARKALETEAKARVFAILNGIALLALAVLTYDRFDAADLSIAIPLALSVPFLVLLARPLRPWTVAAFASAALVLTVQSSMRLPPRLRLPLMPVSDAIVLVDRVRALTGWSRDEARDRIFYVDKQMEISPKLLYGEGGGPARPGAPDGFFATNQFGRDGTSATREAVTGWLLRQPLPDDLRKAILDGALRLGEPVFDRPVLLVPYTVTSSYRLPSHFGNEGYAYEPVPLGALAGNAAPAGARLLEPGHAIFYWNECPPPVCTTGIETRFSRTGDELEIEAVIRGAPLSQPAEWTGPGWTMAWALPYLEARCGSGSDRAVLVDSVGIDPRHSRSVSGMREVYNSILAPVERKLRLKCRGELRSLEAGRQATLLYRFDGIQRLSPAPQVLSVSGKP